MKPCFAHEVASTIWLLCSASVCDSNQLYFKFLQLIFCVYATLFVALWFGSFTQSRSWGAPQLVKYSYCKCIRTTKMASHRQYQIRHLLLSLRNTCRLLYDDNNNVNSVDEDDDVLGFFGLLPKVSLFNSTVSAAQELGRNLCKRRRVQGKQKRQRHQITGAVVDAGLTTIHHLKKRKWVHCYSPHSATGPTCILDTILGSEDHNGLGKCK